MIRRIETILRPLSRSRRSSASRNNNYRKYFPISLGRRSSISTDPIGFVQTQDFIPSPSPSTRNRERLSRVTLDDLTRGRGYRPTPSIELPEILHGRV